MVTRVTACVLPIRMQQPHDLHSSMTVLGEHAASADGVAGRQRRRLHGGCRRERQGGQDEGESETRRPSLDTASFVTPADCIGGRLAPGPGKGGYLLFGRCFIRSLPSAVRTDVARITGRPSSLPISFGRRSNGSRARDARAPLPLRVSSQNFRMP